MGKKQKLTIAVLGNHRFPFCTEAHLAWSLEHLGHEALRLQEDEISTESILDICLYQNVDLLLYIHTHSWIAPGALTMGEVIHKLRNGGVKTASFHLDRYWGLEINDQRESRVGLHPFWHTDKVFTADGGNQEKFAERRINHVYLPPGVVEYGCYFGRPREEYLIDVGFVGSRHYHPEYPQRTELIEWLEQTYGDRFRRYAGDVVLSGAVRENDLNDLYASIKVVVGDSCFAGAPYYFSDRVPETLGRGGLLLHPKTEGLDWPGLVTYDAGDYEQLKKLIDYYLEHEVERNELRIAGMEHVKNHETYTHRMQTLLEHMELA